MGYKDLDRKTIRFYFDNLHDNNLTYWAKRINRKKDIPSLEKLRTKFEKYLQSLPDITQSLTYNPKSEYNIRGRNDFPKISGGDPTIIFISYEITGLIINLIDSRISNLKDLELKLFKKFGVWNDIENPIYFKLYQDYLPCLVLAFENIKKNYRYSFNEQFILFANVLYKEDGTQYSKYAFRNAWHRIKTKNDNLCMQEKGFSIEESTELLEYLINHIK